MIVEMIIKFDTDTEKIAVLAPMAQKPLCYHMLKQARKTIEKYRTPLLKPGAVGTGNAPPAPAAPATSIESIPLIVVGGGR